MKEAEEYWRDALADSHSSTSFPALPPSLHNLEADSMIEYQIPLIRNGTKDITTPNLVRAAWALIIGRMASSDDIVFGITLSEKHVLSPDNNRMATPATATFPMRVKFASGQTIAEYLERIQQQSFETALHEHLDLQQISKLCPGSHHACKFRTLLDIRPPQRGIATTENFGKRHGVSQQQQPQCRAYALTLNVQLGSEEMIVSASYDSGIFESSTVQRILDQLDCVLHQLDSADPDQTLQSIQMVTEQDLEMIWQWNNTVPKPAERFVHEIIEEQARVQPSALAVCAWDGELTYAELDQLATRLAAQLIAIGVKPDVLVPLCFEKSKWTTVAMIGVLKAGGAFVMLDPSLPEQRLRIIVQQVKATLILSSPLNEGLTSRLSGKVLTVGSEYFRTLQDQVAERVTATLSPSALMYVVFTSGSTGTPKGVTITHQNLASAVHHQIKLLDFTTKSRIFDFAAYSYDVSISNAITALVAGGCLCVPSDQDRRSNLAGSIAALEANVVVLTPSIARLLSPEDIPKLELVILVGESVSITDVKRWWGKVHFVHRYGVSECPAASTINCNARSAEEATRIGKGAGLVTWIVEQDDHNYLIPIGHIGELLLEGPLVSRGYLDDSEKTAEKFIYNPPWLLEGAPGRPGRSGRVYKTGDLVRYNEDGSLSYLGRKDTQVKIRGQRAELGEIEHHVQDCIPDAEQVVAELIVPQGDDSSPTLAAFLLQTRDTVAVKTAEANTPESAVVFPIPPGLMTKLAERLPSYMLPTVFFSLWELPMTPTGKTNRRRLREIGSSFTAQQLIEMKSPGHGIKRRQPELQIERQMRRIWATVLGIEQSIVGLDDGFLQLGGDSIAAMKVVAEAHRDGLNLTVADIFGHTTLEQVASHAKNSSVHTHLETVPPFSLIARAGRTIDVNLVLRDISNQFQLDLATIEDVYPCTALQEGLLSLSAAHPGDYVKTSIMELSPDIEVGSFCNAWQEVVQATAIMRTRIVHHKDIGLMQVVLNEDIRWIEATELETYLEADRKQSMGMGQPLTRYALVNDLGKSRWFVWTVHHALYDGWSMPLILQAVRQVYKGDVAQSTPRFNTFIKYITGQDQGRETEYWRQALTDCDSAPFPVLPVSVQRPVADKAIEYQIPHRPSRGHPHHVTTSNLIRAAWAMVAGRMTNSDDVLFGVTVSGRNAPVVGIDKMVAPTIATVPVRIRIPRAQRVSDYLEAVQRQATEMIPFEQTGLQRIAKICPGSQQACTFQTLLVIQPEDDGLGAQDLFGRWQDNQQQQWFDTYALTLEIQLGLDNIRVLASYDSRVIESWMVQKMLEQFDSVLVQISGNTNPDKTVTEIQMIPEQDLKKIWEWNSPVPTAIERCVHHIIEEWSEAQPNASAVCAWDGELTYSELDHYAVRLARRLVQLGIGSDAVVPLCFEKSMWTPVAMLGVLKAGGAFVMLDPSLPELRLQTIVREVDAKFVVSSLGNKALSLRLSPKVVVINQDTTVRLDHDASDDRRTMDEYPLQASSPTSAMYVVFTSGSTGNPKGSMITHINLASALHYQIGLLGLSVESRVFDFASYSFDVCISNVFAALVAGGCLCIPNDYDRKNNLVESIRSLKANFVELTPSVAQLLSPDDMPKLNTLILGGEAVSIRDAERWWHKCSVINTYGPSECTPTSTVNSKASSPEEATRLGDGAGVVTWVVDPENHDNLLPLGSIGELLLEGPLVGRGYLNNPEKTAAAFIQDPAWLVRGGPGQPGRHGRVYKTGDLVRYDEDGALTFFGRKDTQVKIRGQRVELGEIEQRVQECFPDAIQVVAEIIVLQGENAKPTLAVFLQKKDSMKKNGAETTEMLSIEAGVEDQLAERLPSYMIPTVFFSMNDLPISPTGKADRKQLREIGGSFSVQQLAEIDTTRTVTKQQPTTELERQIQNLWAQVLNIDPATIGLDDSFFRLGGDSITAMQVSSAARSLSLNISTLDIMQKKKISSLIQGLSAAGPMQNAPTTSTLETLAARGYSRQLSPMQRLYTHLETDLTKPYDQRFFLKLRTKIGHEPLLAALETLVRRHDILRARFSKNVKGVWEQEITNDTARSLRLRTHQWSADSDDKKTAQAIAQCRGSLNIENGPLVAAALFDDGSDEGSQSLFIAIHHLVVDLVSWRVIFREMEELLTSGTITMPTSMAFHNWVDLQAQYASQNLDSMPQVEMRVPLLSYWGMEKSANLQRDAIFTHFSIDKHTSSLLLGRSNDAFGTRPVELMLSALIYSFSLVFPDRPSPTIFSEGHGREPWDSAIDIATTVGWFTTIYPVQVATQGKTASLPDIIRLTKDYIRSLPRNGWSHFTSRFASEANAAKFAAEFPAEIMFNYAGLYQQLERSDAFFEEVKLPNGCDPASGLELRRWALFDIDVRVENGCVDAVISYHMDMVPQQNILDWVSRFKQTVIQIAEDLSNASHDWTLCDFPLAFQSYDDIREFREVWLDRLEIRAADVEDIFPCSPMQEGILVAQAKDSRNYRSFVELEVQVRGGEEVRLDLTRLKNAWLAVVRQHALLRCVLVDKFPGSSRPMHVILRDPQPSMSVVSRDETDQPMNATAAAYGKYDLQHHVTIREIDERRAHVRLEMDHSIVDGFSNNMLLEDLQTAYDDDNSLRRSGAYRDFITYLEEQSYDNGLGFWTQHLANVEPCFLRVSTGNNIVEAVANTGPVEVPHIDVEKLRDFCSKSEVTAATVIQTAWGLVLRRYTGAQSPCFGNLCSGRDVPVNDADRIFGPLIGMVPCRVQFNSEDSVLETLKKVQDDYLSSLPHQHFPLAAIHRALGLGASALFNSGLSFQRAMEDDSQRHNELTIRSLNDNDPTEYDINISAVERSKQIRIQLNFRPGTLTSKEASQLAGCIRTAISEIILSPSRRIKELSLLGDVELEKIWKWNSTVPEPLEQCVHEIIEAKARSHPDAPAICAWDGELTYGELDKLTTRLAGRLVDLGVRPNAIVPLCFEKSMWTNVAIIGVLKAGGAFVLLDPSLPEQRLQVIVQQVEANLILCSTSTQALSSRLTSKVVTINSNYLENERGDTDSRQLPDRSPSSILYVVFTSGSTGTPKGVIINHRNMASALSHQVKLFGLTSPRILDFASYSFDASIFNAFITLAAGGCLCVPSDQGRKDNLLASIKMLRANFLILTPSAAQFLSPDDLPELQALMFCGEAVRTMDVTRWWKRVRTLNGYGPSECTPMSTFNYSSHSLTEATRIGKGAGLVTWVVEPENHDRLAPIGSVGELLLEGPLVGPGYLKDPEKTAATFINNPTWLLEGSPSQSGRQGRLYMTGDLVQYNEDGTLVFVGRKDEQVKIRGQRVELGEVEHCIQECIPQAQHAIAEVIFPKGDSSNPMLAAFLQMDKQNSAMGPNDFASLGAKMLPITADVEDQLAKRLPSYMVPSVFFSMLELPMTATGKLDRKRLREIGGSFTVQQLAELRTAGKGPKRKPATHIEQEMQRIWADILNIDSATIGLDDSFFRLGGDSIAAMKVVAEARKAGIDVAVADIFNHPKLQSVASKGVHRQGNAPDEIPQFSLLGQSIDVDFFLQDASSQCQVDQNIIEDAYPCTQLQEGLMSLSLKRPGDYILQRTLEISPNVDITAFRNAWQEVARKMPILRTRIVQYGDVGLFQVVLDEAIRWTEAKGLDEYLEADRILPMETGRPLLRFAFIKDDAETYKWFVLTVHHSLYDGWSLSLILDTVQRAYNGNAIDSQLPSFKSFVKYTQDLDHKRMADYWRSALADCDSVQFPALSPSLQEPVADGLIERQLSLANPGKRSALDITTSTLTRAAWAIVASRITNSDDIVFGVTVSGRNAPVNGIEQMAGPTIATVPLRIKAPRTLRVADYLQTVQDQATGMIPFEQTGLQRIINIDSVTQQACKFQTLLVIQPNQHHSPDGFALGKWQDESQEQLLNTYPLMLELQLGDAAITATVNFDSRVVESWRVNGLLDQLESVMQQVSGAKPEQTLSSIEVITSQDLATIWGWNKTIPAALEQCVHLIVEERARIQPNTPAVCAWDGELTYEMLNSLAARVAHRIVHFGIGTNAIVPLCFEKSKWTMVAILGVLKAGGAFVLLEPSLPEQRLYGIVQQVKAPFILSSHSNRALSLQLAQTVITIDMDFFQEEFDYKLCQNILPKVDPSSAVYVVFTSGSTGVPKGVVITHQNLASALDHQVKLFEFANNPRIFDFASYAFDASIFNAFITLGAGGCLCIPSDHGRKDDLVESIKMLKANIIILTPSVSQFLSPQDLPDLQSIMFCGEAVYLKDVKPWWKKVKVLNGYGPGECTPMSTFNYYSSSPEEALRIGKGAGSVTWVVNPDNHNDLLPIGCVGELLLEGPLVGSGYLNDPQKTARVFIKDPEWLIRGIPGRILGRHGRLYKTGDLVQYNEDGSLTFIGRKDAQVKIRGQRVELGEVEHWVQESIPQARRIVADIIELQSKGNPKPTLAAFIQTESDTEIDTANILAVSSDVKDNIAQHLPRYMVPTVFISISKLPLMATGKTDRKRLREIGSSFSVQQVAEMQTREKKRKPTSEMELKLQMIWAKVLNIDLDTIGSDDSFFRLGGDSITAMKVVGEARKVGVQLAVADIFSSPQLYQLADNSVFLREDALRDIPSFSLLPDGLISNLDSFVQDVSLQCQVESTIVKDAYPCTPLQEGLLSLSLKRSGDYIMQRVLELSSNIDLGKFRNAWEEVARSTAIMRTRITQHNIGFLQVVLDDEIQWFEATGLDDYLEADKKSPMEIGMPLVRFSLIREYDLSTPKWFVWTVHHALYDGWSLPLIVNKVAQRYHDNAFQFSPQPQFKLFVDYIRHQNKKDATEYWRKSLAESDCAPFPSLPPSVQQPLADKTIEHKFLPRPTARETPLDITTANLVRAAWALALGYSMNLEEVVFGVTISGRSAPVVGIEDIAGPTIATIPVRIKLAGEDKVSEYLEAVQKQALEMMPFEHTGLHRISKLSPGCQQACTFQTLLVIQPASSKYDERNSSTTQQQLLGEWHDASQEEAFNTYALTLEIQLSSDEKSITAKASFDSRAIELRTVHGLLERLDLVMQQLYIADGEQALGAISMLTQRDLETIWGWNRTVPEPREQNVHNMVAECARTHPNAPAICAWDGQLTYGELDEFATRLAVRLLDLGIRSGVRVPLCFEKSMWAMIALLGVLKAGGVFVLLDPSLPEKRLNSIIQQVNATLILSSPSNKALSSRLAKEVITIDRDFFSKQPRYYQTNTHILPEIVPSSDMYVVFTSGSTGKPKGVMIQHRNLASALCHQAIDHGVTMASRVFDFASYSFDASIINIFMALTAGACLCVPSDEDRKNDLAGCINSLGATVAHLTPSVAQFLSPEEVPSLQTVILAGEAVHVGDVKRWWGKVNLFNIYGPSECTPFSTINCCTSTPEAATGIGKGSGQVTWIVDPQNHDRLVPLGSIGELLLEGPLVGPGYVGEPEKTAAAFIHDPDWLLHGIPGYQPGRRGRLYKTGDLVRYNEDGSLSFVGRKDDQVKIRGQRVELGEVENCVQQHMQQAKQVVAEVILPRGQDSRPTLAAFVQLHDGEATITNGRVREPHSAARIMLIDAAVERNLARHLPHYMVPTVFFAMEELPMTATGKANRRELRQIGASFFVKQLAEARTTVQGVKTKLQPNLPLERLLQRIWAEVLNIELEAIGIDDNFFQLGGDSIAAMKVVGEARKIGMKLSVAHIFRKPTLRRLAQLSILKTQLNKDEEDEYDHSPLVDPILKEGLLSEIDALEIDIKSGAVASILPITQFQEEKVVRGINDPRQFCNYFYLDFGHNMNVKRFERNCSVTLERYPILRASFLPLLGTFWQVIPHRLDAAVTIQDVSQDLDQAFLEFCLKDMEEVSPTRPPIAFSLLRRKDQSVRFVLRLSHAQYDGVSLPTIIQSLLGSHSDGMASQRPLDFSEFLAYTHRRRLKSRSYWKQLLRGSSITKSASKLAPKSIDYVSPTAIELDAEVSLPRLPGNITSASLLCSAWAVLLSHITGEDDVVFGRLVAGRNAAIDGIEDMVGPCANIVPVRVSMSSLQTPTDLLLSVQEQYITLGEADSLSLRDISENCTDWPIGSAFDSTIQHQNVDEHPEFRFEGATSNLDGFRNPHNMNQSLYMMSHPRGDHLKIELSANTRIMTAETANSLLNGLCRIVEKLTSRLNAPLRSCMDEIKMEL
ncbi:hypothetical protein BGZ63DRAFT_427622 [Mariannaea sp. PMI_226]|nr:hypothetical protein BGZ63DRAFT_427622 [Mariannaea sp. PMI_226]